MKSISTILLTAAVFSTAAKARNNTPEAVGSASPDQLTEAQIDSLERAAYGDDVRSLQELVVTADAPMIKVEGNQISYDVTQDPAAASQSALDMLRRVPMVSVDGQDNISLKGNSDIKIYVNGRPDPMLSSNASTVLKAMPAAAIAKVEVIPDPGAKFDAEGTAGIINLVTETKRSDNGYNDSLNAGVSNRDFMLGGFGAAKLNKLTLNANITYMNQRFAEQPGNMASSTIYNNSTTDHRLEVTARTPRKFEYLGAGLSSSWEPSAADLFNFSLNYTDMSGYMKTVDEFTQMYDAAGDLSWSYLRQAQIDIRIHQLTANAAWQHSFGRPDNYLALNYQFDYSKNSTPLAESFSECINYALPYSTHTLQNVNHGRTHTAQADYSNTLSEHATIEAGLKGIFRHNSAIGRGEADIDLNQPAPLESEYSSISQLQDILAAYALYKANYGQWHAEAGLRYEYTRMGIRYHYGNLSDFTNSFNDLVPNAGITYSFSPMHALGLTYGMRIARPTIEQVNPFLYKYSETQATQGNPELRSERINKISLSYRNFGRIFGFNLSLDFAHTGNAISPYSFLSGSTLVSSQANIGRKESLALNAFVMITPSSKLRLNFSGMAGYTDLSANITTGTTLHMLHASNHGMSGNINHNGQFSLPADLELSWYGGYRWGEVGLQTKGGDFFYYGLALSRDFLPNRNLRLALNAGNFAQAYLKFTNTTTTPDFTSRSTYRVAAWRVGLTATWTFGKTNSRVKTLNSTIENTDLSTSSTGAPSASTPNM